LRVADHRAIPVGDVPPALRVVQGTATSERVRGGIDEHEVVAERALERAAARRGLLLGIGLRNAPAGRVAHKRGALLLPEVLAVDLHAGVHARQLESTHVVGLDLDHAAYDGRLDATEFPVGSGLEDGDPVVLRVDSGIGADKPDGVGRRERQLPLREHLEDARPVDAVRALGRLAVVPVALVPLEVHAGCAARLLERLFHALGFRHRDGAILLAVKDEDGQLREVGNQQGCGAGQVRAAPKLVPLVPPASPRSIRVETLPCGAGCDTQPEVGIVRTQMPGAVAAHRVAGEIDAARLRTGRRRCVGEHFVGVLAAPVLPVEAERATVGRCNDPQVGLGRIAVRLVTRMHAGPVEGENDPRVGPRLGRFPDAVVLHRAVDRGAERDASRRRGFANVDTVLAADSVGRGKLEVELAHTGDLVELHPHGKTTHAARRDRVQHVVAGVHHRHGSLRIEGTADHAIRQRGTGQGKMHARLDLAECQLERATHPADEDVIHSLAQADRHTLVTIAVDVADVRSTVHDEDGAAAQRGQRHLVAIARNRAVRPGETAPEPPLVVHLDPAPRPLAPRPFHGLA